MFINRSVNRFVNRPQGLQSFRSGTLSSRSDIDSLIGGYANHVRERSFRETVARALRTMVVNRWIVRRNIMKESHADTTVVSRYVPMEHRLAGRFRRFAGKGSMKPRPVDSTIPLIPRSSRALSSTWNLINAARRWRWASMSATLAH